jgi:hypothetical protein
MPRARRYHDRAALSELVVPLLAPPLLKLLQSPAVLTMLADAFAVRIRW